MDSSPAFPVLDAAILRELGVGPDACVGYGGEAVVFALDAERVARVHHAGTEAAGVAERTALLAELALDAGRVPFAIPEVLETRVAGDRVVTIERRLPGRPLGDVLREASGGARTALIGAYLEAAARVGDLGLERPFYGDLIGAAPVRAPTFRGYLLERAQRSLAEASADFAGVDPRALADALPEPSRASVVHLDVFPGNVLVEAGRVTAVLDFGATSAFGDRRLDPLTAAAYLEPPITADATGADRAIARAWLAERGLEPWLDPARRWAAAFWTRATDDAKVQAWCRSILLPR